MEVCGVVILYYPDGKIIERIETYKDALKNLFIIDNSPTNNRQLLEPLLADRNIFYLHDGQNEGIAKRLNQAAELARQMNCTWLLTMDQDSYFGKAVVKQYLVCASCYDTIAKVAMFGLEHDERLLLKQESCTYTKKTYLITSGSLVQLEILISTNGFDENLFIDHVDHEYCFRSILNGYEIIKMENFLLRHAIGNSSQHRSFKSLKITSRELHSPVRIYYMVRNFLYLRKKYTSQFETELSIFKRNLFIRFKNNLLYNGERLQVLKYMLKGYRDFILNKKGIIQ